VVFWTVQELALRHKAGRTGRWTEGHSHHKWSFSGFCLDVSVSPKQPDRQLEATGPAVRTDRTAADITITDLYDLTGEIGVGSE
jgi:hypothetical protein